MSFLNPGLLWGCLLFLVPIIIYLIFQRRIKEMDWAAMQFLMDIMEQKRKTTIEDLLLLLLRILMILFLALAVARPLFQSDTMASMMGSEGDIVLLLDNSYSMGSTLGAQTRWDKAREYAVKVINEQPSGTGVSIVLANTLPDPIVADFSNDYSLLEETTRSLEISALGSNWPSSLTTARDLLKESQKGLKKLYIVSDFQQQDWLELDDNTQSMLRDLNENYDVSLVAVGDNTQENVSAVRLRLSAGAMRTGSRATFAADVMNHGSELAENLPVDFIVDGDVVESSTVSVAPQQTTSIRFHYEAIEDGLHEASVRIRGDTLLEDNEAFLPFEVVESISVLSITEGENDYGFLPTYFIDLALNPFTEGHNNEEAIYQFEDTNVSELTGSDLSQYDFICMSGVKLVSSLEAQKLREYVHAGGGLLIFLGNETDVPTYNQNMYNDGKGLFAWPLNVDKISKSRDQSSMRMHAANLSHPIWNGLVDHQNDYLKHVKIYETYTFNKGSEEFAIPLANLIREGDEEGAVNNSDNPIIVDFSKGRGHCIVVGTSSDLSMNDFISHPVFVGFINQTVKYARSFKSGDTVITAGLSAKRFVNFQSSQANYAVTSPSGDTFILPVTIDGEEYRVELPELRESGFYNMVNQSDSSDSAIIAVNAPSAEGNIISTDPEALKTLIPEAQLSVINATQSEELDATFGSGNTELATLLLFLVLLCWIGENYLAHRISKR